jgi:hypothetical protein
MNKPRIFIGSSVEGLKIANSIQENLDHFAEVTVWTQDIFRPANTGLESILKISEKCDYAIFVFTPDDLIEIRGVQLPKVRDNIIFETGLFIGKLSAKKVFYIKPRNEKLELPTDLLGIISGEYNAIRSDNNYLAATNPFCSQITRIIQEDTHSALKDLTLNLNDNENIQKSELPKISKISTVFFNHRVSSAFPAIRGLEWFLDPEIAVERLCILLQSPLRFEYTEVREARADPIWWFRGNGALFIDNFKSLTKTKCLMDIYELEIEKIAAYRADSYYRDLVYIEVKGEKQTGAYNITEKEIKNNIEYFGYSSEEFGLFGTIPIKREEYDDGAAVINGKVTETLGKTQLRKRYLSKYNFIIAAADSPYNSPKFEDYSKEYLDGILKGTHTLEDLIEISKELRKNESHYL